jgi:peptide/nickel transport system substrate-binding protein
MRRTIVTAIALVAGLVAGGVALPSAPAVATPASNTLTVSFNIPFSGLDYYAGSYPHTEFITRMIFDGLVEYDPKTLSVTPILAKSWERVGDNTIEFTLRDDVKWHDGTSFSADDVVYTFGWITNPANAKMVREQWLWAWVDHAEKIAPDKVRLVMKKKCPYDLLLLAYTPIYPAKYHAGLADKKEFGRKPIGTGPYKLVQYDEANGVIVEQNPDYHHGGEIRKPTNIKRIKMRYIADDGTQVAELLTGGVELFRDIPAEQAIQLTADPRFEATFNAGVGLTYMWFDATGRSGNDALKNPKVRQALAMAVDRTKLATILEADRKVVLPENMCWKESVAGCDFSKTMPKYDPVAAKKLLAEAGYPDGFDVEITSYVGRVTMMAEAVAGYYKAIGVRATIASVTLTTFQQKAASGKMQMAVLANSLSGIPDISRLISFFFQTYDYTGDAEMKSLADRIDSEMDPLKRKALARQFFDRDMEQAYIVPLNSLTHVFPHIRELAVREGSVSTFGVTWQDLSWK